MKEKILAALKTKFQGIEEAILDRQAEKLAKTVTQEDQIETALSGVNFGTLLQSETDRRTTEATSTAVKNYEKKHKLKDGKPIEDPGKKKPDPDPKKKGDEGDDDEKMPAWAKSLSEKLDSYDERLTKQEKDRERSSKLDEAMDLLAKSKIPQKYHARRLKLIDVDDEETSLEDQVKALENEYLEEKQDHVNESVKEGETAQGGETTDADMKEYLDDKFPEIAESAEAK